jgi:excisionase family DNA binding protein
MSPLLTPAEVATLLSCSSKTVYRLAERDASMPAIRLPGQLLRFDRERLLAWVQDHAQGRAMRSNI